jgi:hypothetical protein
MAIDRGLSATLPCDECKQLPKVIDGRTSCACPNKSWYQDKGVQGTAEEQARLKQLGYTWDGRGHYWLPNCPWVLLYEDGTSWDLDPRIPGVPESLNEYLDWVEEKLSIITKALGASL